MLLHMTGANLGYSCGELHGLAATAHLWQRFPWVLTLSGPDVLALPREFELLSRLLADEYKKAGWKVRRAAQEEEEEEAVLNTTSNAAIASNSSTSRPTALLFDKFRKSKNDPLSYVEARYNMDLFIYFPRAWIAQPPSIRAVSMQNNPDAVYSLWASAAAHCVNSTRNRPEAILHVVQKEHNLSFRKIGNGSRGSLVDLHKWTQEPDASVWHTHNMPGLLRWLQSDRSPMNPYRRARQEPNCPGARGSTPVETPESEGASVA